MGLELALKIPLTHLTRWVTLNCDWTPFAFDLVSLARQNSSALDAGLGGSAWNFGVVELQELP